jgi:hypothetical protein
MFPDDDLENYLRDVADMPELSEGQLEQVDGVEGPMGSDDLKKHVAGMLARRFERVGLMPRRATVRKRKGPPRA